MDEKLDKYEPSDVLKTNQNLFKDYCFKFEGLSDECERGFTYIIKDLGGKVSKKAKYTLVEKSYFEKDENKKRKDLYHLNYVLDSLNFAKPLDIELYRCDKNCNENDENSPSIFQIKSSKDNNGDICNTTVRNNFSNESNSDDVPISEIKQSKLQDSDKILKKNTPKVKKRKLGNVSNSDTGNSSSDESVKIKQEQKSSDSSEDDSVEIKSEPKSSESSEDESDLTVKCAHKNKTVNVKIEASSSSDDSTNTDTDSEPLTRKRRKKESDLTGEIKLQKTVSQKEKNSKATKRTWVDTKDLQNERKNDKDNNEERNNSCSNSTVEWTKTKVEERDDLKWLFTVDPDDLCKIKRCKYEPVPHESHCYPGRVISDEEKKVILKYLIKNNLIHRAKGIRTWELMINEGYLTHRSADTLRNCLRRVILPGICKFNLPVDILDQFLMLDDKKVKGKKIW